MNNIIKIDEICKKFDIKNYVINKDGSIDVNGDVILYHKGFKKLPLKFNTVYGKCIFSNNKLVTLKGSPVYVGGNFICLDNELENLRFSPKEIKGSFNCSYNKIKSLKHGPKNIKNDYCCNNNNLISLKDVPKIIYGGFYFSYNNITSLKCGPEYVYGNYYCGYNKLKNLKGCAKYIGGDLCINNNPDLYTFEGLMCNVKDIICKNTIVYNIWKLFKDVSKIELFNDMDIIRENDNGKPVIILDRLNEFLDMLGKPRVEYVEGYINI